MADSDFDAITLNRKMCDANGNIGSVEFCNIMKRQIRYYTQQRLSENAFTKFKTPEDAEFTQLGALKLILLEQLSHTSTLSNICAHLQGDRRGGGGGDLDLLGGGRGGGLGSPWRAPKNANASLRKLPVRRTSNASMRERSAPFFLDDEQSAGAYPSPSCCAPPENVNERLSCDTSGSVPSKTSGQKGRDGSCPGQPAPPAGPDETGGDAWAAAVAGRCAASVQEKMSSMEDRNADRIAALEKRLDSLAMDVSQVTAFPPIVAVLRGSRLGMQILV